MNNTSAQGGFPHPAFQILIVYLHICEGNQNSSIYQLVQRGRASLGGDPAVNCCCISPSYTVSFTYLLPCRNSGGGKKNNKLSLFFNKKQKGSLISSLVTENNKL